MNNQNVWTFEPSTNKRYPVRTLIESGELWLNAKDVTGALNYYNTAQALDMHVESRNINTFTFLSVKNTGRNQFKRDMLAVNEAGLYELIIGSHKPNARLFKNWVTSEVLPAIMRTGQYETSKSNVQDLLNNAFSANDETASIMKYQAKTFKRSPNNEQPSLSEQLKQFEEFKAFQQINGWQ
ncbi:Bro-N domain-containing protein [Leuconostoc sp. MS02]|uniref:Bro-N domain-containing protein n=1 Tax=Leuconostoc aquikimchii TaxID=3236804 RepID=A0ABV3S4W2_9LACO